MKYLLLALLLTSTGCEEVISEASPADDGNGSDAPQSSVNDGVQPDASDCPEGTTGTPGSCVDVNECAVDASGMNDCGDADYVSCTNQEAGPPICADINECDVDSQGDNGCGDASLFDCTNRDAAPPLCVDVDECLTDNGGCGDPELMDCVNQEAAPPLCQPASQEPDPCDTEDAEACGVNGSCIDPGVGPAACTCDAGFAGDGWICAPSDTSGCTNPKASNYAPWATKSSKDCVFPVTFTVDLNGSGFSPIAPVYIQGGFND